MTSALRAALYLRVSTTRQVEVDLSIPDQKLQCQTYCARNAWTVIDTYVEPGASAMDDQRPEFQRLIERACDDDHPFDVIVVHSFSRFFRDAFSLEMYIRRLAKHGVRLVSITQEPGDDPSQVMMRQIIAMFDEYQSRENAKHVLRAMKENARQGFYNGSPVPLGYVAQAVEKRGHRIKKRLAIDPVEAETVKRIFTLSAERDGTGPMGVKTIAKTLNNDGFRTRKGARFGLATIHGILTNPVYIGQSRFNQRQAKTLKKKPEAEIVTAHVPPIIETPLYEQVQATLKTRHPKTTPPRITTGPILLTGLAHCGNCGGAMTLRTGTSSTGRIYRYYTCSTTARIGKDQCKGRSIPMDRLDELVTQNICDKVLTPEHLSDLLQSVMSQRAQNDAEVQKRIEKLKHEAAEAENKLKRLYSLVEDGLTDLDEMLKDRIETLKETRNKARAALERISTSGPTSQIDPSKLAKFSDLMRENLRTGDIPFRKAYLRALIEAIEVGDKTIRIHGSKSMLEQAVIANGAVPTHVRGFVRKWRTRHDSNV